MPPLSIMIKPASSSCNMRCRYCFYADVASNRENANYGTMSLETARRLIRRAFLYADGSVSFAFQGGEPTLAGLGFFQDFLNAVRQCNARSLPVYYALQTNGYALTDELCAFFAENRFLLGVSLDGTREIHDALRRDAQGQGTYDRVLQGIGRLKKHGVEYNILCVVTAAVAARAKDCWDSLKEHRFLQYIPCIDAFSGELRDYSLSAEAYGHFLTDTFVCYEQAYFSGHPVSERRMDNYLAMLMGQPPELCGMSGVCGHYFLAEADGGIYPCDFYVLDDWRLGNIQTDSLQRMAKGETAQRFRQRSRVLPPACAQCSWLFLCHGGCRRDREPYIQSQPSENRFCKSYRMFFEACYPRMQALARHIAKADAGR